MSKVLTDDQFDRVMRMLRAHEADSGFSNSKTPTLSGDAELWLKITGLAASTWDSHQCIYTVDIFVSPLATTALHTGAKAFNAAECDPSKSIPLTVGEWCKAVDYIGKSGQDYHVFNSPRTSGVVKLVQTGGSLGANGYAQSTWTYSIKDLSSTITIATAIGPSVRLIPTWTDAASFGLAGFFGGAWHLIEALEPIHDEEDCDPAEFDEDA